MLFTEAVAPCQTLCIMGNGALSPTNSQDSYDEEAGGSTYNASSGSSPKSADKQMKVRKFSALSVYFVFYIPISNKDLFLFL